MRRTFEIFYEDGNRRLFESPCYSDLLLFLVENNLYKKVIDIKERM